MMTDYPVQLVMAVFQEEDAADRLLEELEEAEKEWCLEWDDAAVLRRDEKGDLHVKETGDVGGGKGAGIGVVLGGLIGLLAGPAGLVVGAGLGGLVGGVTAKLYDAGISNERLEQFGEALKPGTSALVLILASAHVEVAQEDLAEQGAEVLVEDLWEDAAEQLAAEKEAEEG